MAKGFLLYTGLFLFCFIFIIASVYTADAMRGPADNMTPTIEPAPTLSGLEEDIDPSEWFEVDKGPYLPPINTEPTEPSKPTTKPSVSVKPATKPDEPTEGTTPTLPKPTVPPLNSSKVEWYSDIRVYPTGEITTTAGGAPIDIIFFAKLLYCEAGIQSWEGQVYTASAILNFCDRYNLSMWEAGHTENCFAAAPWVDDAIPTQKQYDVIEYVLNGGRIEKICHFRTKHYHTFGTPICTIDDHYFSIA